MNKYQRFALNHFLSYYPEHWSYDQIMSSLIEQDGDNITVWNAHGDESPEQVAEYIEQMAESLQDNFGG